MSVSGAAIGLMFLSAALAILVPVALLIFVMVKYKAKIVPCLVGAGAFVLFALVLEQILHAMVLRPATDGTIALMARPALYVLYGTLAAGVFEETARFIAFHLLKKRYTGAQNAVSYGIGHGGIESIILAGLPIISNIANALLINSGAMEGVLAALPEQTRATAEAGVQALVSAPAYMFAFGGIERLLAIAAQIALSVVVYYAVAAKGKTWLYPVAIILHAFINVAAALAQAGVLQSMPLVEALTAAAVACVVAFAILVHRRLRTQAPLAEPVTAM